MKRTVALVFGTAMLLLGQQAYAGDDNPECLGSSCGRPKEEGGGCGCGCGCSVWVAYTDDGVTLAYTDDADGDGKADDNDNCAFVSNRDQLDTDGDGVGNLCDNAMTLSNFNQLDTDGDGVGDVADEDTDGDTILDKRMLNGVLTPTNLDNCPLIPNRMQANHDTDALGDVCDNDDDNDGILDRAPDFCPFIADPTNPQTIAGQQCAVDSDNDTILDAADNCQGHVNLQQTDTDNDGLGDVCDLDADNDGINDKKIEGAGFKALELDNCPLHANRNQFDDDGDKLGDACDAKYCVVVDSSNPEDCLDPQSPFRVHAGGSIAMVEAGKKIRLPLFANRNGAGIEYTWTVTKRPDGSKAAVENPTGVVSMSRHWEYAYPNEAPSFTADVTGNYEITLQARLTVADRAYPGADQRQSQSTLKLFDLKGGGVKPQTASCNAVPVDASLLALGLAALALRRRRS